MQLRLIPCLLLAVLGVAGLGPSLARAQSFEDAQRLIASTRFEDIERGIDAVGRSGHPQALAIIEALDAGTVLVRASDKALFIKLPSGALLEAATGAAADAVAPAGLKPVRVNNRVRRSIEAALGALTLLSPDPVRRLAAAQAVSRSRDPIALPALETALAGESVAAIRRAMETARAAILLGQPDAPEPLRIAAIATLRGSGGQEALGLLRGLPADTPEGVRAAAAEAIAAIARHQALIARFQDVVYGISLGSVLLLAAIGLAITFGVMGVINMAHGEMVMLGAYTTFLVQDACRASAPWLMPFSLAIALPLAFLAAGLVGVAIERGIIRFLYGRPLETLLATFGLSLVLQQAVRSAFGPSNREVQTPAWMSGSVDLLGGLTVTANRLVIVLFGLAVFALLLVIIRRSRLGLEMRAVTQNRRMAASMGIRTGRVDALTFGLGSGVAGLAGVALSQIDNVSPNLGQGYIIDSFLVVVLGGVGNLWGTLTGALALGIANKLLEPAVGAVLGKILLLLAIILFIQKRPRGLFALKGRAVEA